MTELAFKQWIAERIAPRLKERGYVRRGFTFIAAIRENRAFINLQRSAKSRESETIFTFNLGVWVARLGRFLDPGLSIPKVTLQDCHWTARAGELLLVQEDKWWHLISDQPDERMLVEVESLLFGKGLVTLAAMGRDETLRDLWLSGRSPGLTDVQRLTYLSILLRLMGPFEHLDKVLEELQQTAAGKPVSQAVARHIRLVRGWNGS